MPFLRSSFQTTALMHSPLCQAFPIQVSYLESLMERSLSAVIITYHCTNRRVKMKCRLPGRIKINGIFENVKPENLACSQVTVKISASDGDHYWYLGK